MIRNYELNIITKLSKIIVYKKINIKYKSKINN